MTSRVPYSYAYGAAAELLEVKLTILYDTLPQVFLST